MKHYHPAFIDQLMQDLPTNVYWKDVQGKFVECNLAQALFSGVKSREELIGKTDFDMSWKADAPGIRENDKKVMDSKESTTFEELAVIKGEQRYFLSRKSPVIDADGKILGVMGISYDITDKKRREELEKKEKEDLLRANNTLKFWASAIAHELRTPLASLAMASAGVGDVMEEIVREYPVVLENGLLKRKIKHLLSLPKFFEDVIKNANHFIDMTLMKSKATEQGQNLELIPLRIESALEAALETYPFKEGERAKVHIDIQDNFTFMGEENAFKHIIYNLNKNALLFIRKARKGEIFITAKSGEKENVLIFKDTGPGIPQEILKNLFQPFYSRSQNGTGVGLTLCKNIMENFGGRISCEAVEGEFSAFSLWFPRV